MNRHNIITLPNPHLRDKSKKIHTITDDIRQLVTDMAATTLDWEDHRSYELGVALAAVQVDRLYRIVVVRNNFDDKDDRTFFPLINPEIIKAEGKPEYGHEGCLSVQDIYGLIPRYPRVRVKALDLNGKDIRLRAEGFLARVLQHEIDHTNGILFIDHIKHKDAFFKLNEQGELEKLPHASILKSRILW